MVAVVALTVTATYFYLERKREEHFESIDYYVRMYGIEKVATPDTPKHEAYCLEQYKTASNNRNIAFQCLVNIAAATGNPENVEAIVEDIIASNADIDAKLSALHYLERLYYHLNQTSKRVSTINRIIGLSDDEEEIEYYRSILAELENE